MKGHIRPDKKLETLLKILEAAKKEQGLVPPHKVKVWRDEPSKLDDDELMKAADELRKERNMLASKLIDAGLLDPQWSKDNSYKVVTAKAD